MNRNKITLLFAIALCSAATAQNRTQTEPTRIRIGETIITLQSPLRVQPTALDSIEIDSGIFSRTQSHHTYQKYPRRYEETYIGFGFAVPYHGASYLPVHSGNSFNLEVGVRYLYRPSNAYAIGTFLQYSCYSYRLKEASELFMETTPKGDVYREFFRTDNIGTGLLQRIWFSRRTQFEAIVYGDWAYSKRLVVKSHVNNHKEKSKYRDGTKFNPFGAGVQAGIRYRSTTLYARYRLTNFFNPNEIETEVPRLSIGISFVL